ncbi:hypothetical protein GBA52_009889 [Prunus armeniaca]|nr:hypothetical protein GBA52_009889 [Prunus armeniaca]
MVVEVDGRSFGRGFTPNRNSSPNSGGREDPQWHGNRQIKCNSVGSIEEKQTTDTQNVVVLTNGSSYGGQERPLKIIKHAVYVGNHSHEYSCPTSTWFSVCTHASLYPPSCSSTCNTNDATTTTSTSTSESPFSASRRTCTKAPGSSMILCLFQKISFWHSSQCRDLFASQYPSPMLMKVIGRDKCWRLKCSLYPKLLGVSKKKFLGRSSFLQTSRN